MVGTATHAHTRTHTHACTQHTHVSIRYMLPTHVSGSTNIQEHCSVLHYMVVLQGNAGRSVLMHNVLPGHCIVHMLR